MSEDPSSHFADLLRRVRHGDQDAATNKPVSTRRGRAQHGPHGDSRGVFDVLHHSKPVPLVEPHIAGHMRFKVARYSLLVRSGEHRCHQRTPDSAFLMGRVDADGRQKPVRADRMAGVKPPMHMIEVD